MSLRINSDFNGVTDPDAGAYIAAVEAADGQLLEFAVGKAINDFVVGCKADGIWNAIKASCILAGARTLSGALVPLVGTAPTYNGPFVAGDYNRKTGLLGNNAKYLDTNRACVSEAADNVHVSVFASTRDNLVGRYLGTGTVNPRLEMLGDTALVGFRTRMNSGTLYAHGTASGVPCLIGVSRNSAASYNWRFGSEFGSQNEASAGNSSGNYAIYAANNGGTATSARLAFYSIGESLDLAKLDARVTALINAFGAAIP